MARVKGGTTTRARRKKVLKQAKGYYGAKSKLYKTANEQLMHSLQYAYRDRRTKKRHARALWIIRINAALKSHNISYSKFINGLKKANVEINRKMLSELSANDIVGFANIVNIAKKTLGITVVEDKVSKVITEVKEDEAKKTIDSKEIIEHSIKKVIKKPIKEVIKKPIKKVIKKPIKKVIKKPIKKVIKKSTKKVTKKPVKKIIKKDIKISKTSKAKGKAK